MENLSLYNKVSTPNFYSNSTIKEGGVEKQQPVQTNTQIQAVTSPIEQDKNDSDKKLRKRDIAAICATALSVATAGACLYKSHKNQKIMSGLKETLLFPDGIDKLNFRQSNIGDCYLLSSLFGLSRNQKGQDLIKQMVSISDNGEFIVKFNGLEPIKVLPSQLKGSFDAADDKVRRTVYGDFGLQAIECAYAKYRYQLAKVKNPNINPIKAMEGGKPADALKVLGCSASKIHGDSRTGTLSAQNIDVAKILDELADNFDNKIVCSSTPVEKYSRATKTNGKITKHFMDKNKTFNCKHAYNIAGIDKTNKTVRIVNPHNTQKEFVLGYNEFANIFGRIDEATI